MPQSAHTSPETPFEHIMMDFIELTPCRGKTHCLVIINMLSKWAEAFPAKQAIAKTVAILLLTETLPRWGIPRKISSDNRPHFVINKLTELLTFWGFVLKSPFAYHPQSGGAVERANGVLKSKLTK